MEAIRLSELSYKNELEKQSKHESVLQAPIIPSQPLATSEMVIQPPAPQVDAPPQKAEKIDHPLLRQLEQEKEIQHKMRLTAPRPAANPSDDSNALPALPALSKGSMGFKKLPELSELEKRRDEIANNLAAKQSAMDKDQAVLDERKKRILELREKMQEQKKIEREAQLVQYEELKVDNHSSDREGGRRRHEGL